MKYLKIKEIYTVDISANRLQQVWNLPFFIFCIQKI